MTTIRPPYLDGIDVGEVFRIGCDPEFDLHEAGYSTEEADSLYLAWKEALQSIANEYSLDVRPFRTNQDSEHCTRNTTVHDSVDGKPVEVYLWQAAHDSIMRRDDGTWEAKV